METLLVIILIAVIAGFGVVFYTLYRQRTEKGQDQSLVFLQNQMNELGRTLDTRLSDSARILQTQFGQSTKMIQGITGQSTKMISEITEKLTHLDRTNQQVVSFSEQLSNLEKVLTSQKTRGNLGEAGLHLVLENILPPTAYKLQHKFSNGTIVDAAIFTKEGIIPVDAKFSLDNYRRILAEEDKGTRLELEKEFKSDLKKRIDETSKYIDPNLGTLEFAFMFIPAEAIYYDLLVNEVGVVKVSTRNLIDYAFKEKRVIIVSPTTFAAYLQTVLHGLRALQIEESAKAIKKNVEQLQRHIRAYDEYMRKLGSQMETTVKTYNTASAEFAKIDKDIVKIAGGQNSIEVVQINKPNIRGEE